jgi:hypothetical protein
MASFKRLAAIFAAICIVAGIPPKPAFAFEIKHPSDGLVVKYDFDQSSGSVVVDSSGNGNDGTLSGSYSWDRNGLNGYALNLSGGYIDVPVSVIDSLEKATITLTLNENETSAFWQTILAIGASQKLLGSSRQR